MKATELINKLNLQISRHGDQEIYIEYDGGMRVKFDNIEFMENGNWNEYADFDDNSVTGFVLYNAQERL